MPRKPKFKKISIKKGVKSLVKGGKRGIRDLRDIYSRKKNAVEFASKRHSIKLTAKHKIYSTGARLSEKIRNQAESIKQAVSSKKVPGFVSEGRELNNIVKRVCSNIQGKTGTVRLSSGEKIKIDKKSLKNQIAYLVNVIKDDDITLQMSGPNIDIEHKNIIRKTFLNTLLKKSESLTTDLAEVIGYALADAQCLAENYSINDFVYKSTQDKENAEASIEDHILLGQDNSDLISGKIDRYDEIYINQMVQDLKGLSVEYGSKVEEAINLFDREVGNKASGLERSVCNRFKHILLDELMKRKGKFAVKDSIRRVKKKIENIYSHSKEMKKACLNVWEKFDEVNKGLVPMGKEFPSKTKKLKKVKKSKEIAKSAHFDTDLLLDEIELAPEGLFREMSKDDFVTNLVVLRDYCDADKSKIEVANHIIKQVMNRIGNGQDVLSALLESFKSANFANLGDHVKQMALIMVEDQPERVIYNMEKIFGIEPFEVVPEQVSKQKVKERKPKKVKISKSKPREISRMDMGSVIDVITEISDRLMVGVTKEDLATNIVAIDDYCYNNKERIEVVDHFFKRFTELIGRGVGVKRAISDSLISTQKSYPGDAILQIAKLISETIVPEDFIENDVSVNDIARNISFGQPPVPDITAEPAKNEVIKKSEVPLNREIKSIDDFVIYEFSGNAELIRGINGLLKMIFPDSFNSGGADKVAFRNGLSKIAQSLGDEKEGVIIMQRLVRDLKMQIDMGLDLSSSVQMSLRNILPRYSGDLDKIGMVDFLMENITAGQPNSIINSWKNAIE